MNEWISMEVGRKVSIVYEWGLGGVLKLSSAPPTFFFSEINNLGELMEGQ